MATKLFGGDNPDLFGTLGDSLFTLFTVMTLEGWTNDVVKPVMEKHPYAWLFFVIFIVVTTFMVLNLFIGVVVNAMQAEAEKAEAAEREAEREMIQEEAAPILAEIKVLQRGLGAARGGRRAGREGRRVPSRPTACPRRGAHARQTRKTLSVFSRIWPKSLATPFRCCDRRMEVAGNLQRDSDIAIAKDWRSDCDGGRAGAFGLPVDLPAGRIERGVASAVVLVSALLFLAAAPFAGTAAGVVAGLHPDLRIGAGDQRSGDGGLPVRSDLHLAVAGAAVAGLRLLVHRRADGCTRAHLPGLFSPTGLLGAGPQSTAWLYMFWHGGFPLLVIGYALGRTTRADMASREAAASFWRARR